MSGWRAVRIDDLEAIPWPGAETTWRPLRAAIGARIVGMGAYTAERAGQDVVEPHRDADGMGHEEVYVVLRGRATFTLDGDPERARAIVDELRAARPESPGLPIAEALLAVGRGDREAAVAALGEVREEYREALRADPDLGPLSGGA